MKKEYIIPALYIIDVDTMQMMAASLGECNINTEEGYGPGGSAAAKEWNGFDDQEDDGIYGYEKWDIKWSR